MIWIDFAHTHTRKNPEVDNWIDRVMRRDVVLALLTVIHDMVGNISLLLSKKLQLYTVYSV